MKYYQNKYCKCVFTRKNQTVKRIIECKECKEYSIQNWVVYGEQINQENYTWFDMRNLVRPIKEKDVKKLKLEAL